MAQAKQRLLAGSVGLFALALAGCGGGSGGATRPRPTPAPPPPAAAPTPTPTPVPAPTPTPTPVPTPTPTGINYNDSEYRGSNGATSGNALAAYSAGGTGRGVKIAIVDSGINPNLADFAGRIDPASQDVASNRGVTDTEGHGTAVSAVAAAARNGNRMMGVAFESTILSLNTSDPTDCGGEDGCTHDDAAIGQAIDIARLNGARVINISLGGEGATSAVLSAVNRATSAGIVIVMSAGNQSELNPGGFALQSARSGNGALIIAGAHDSNRDLAGFSNQAGSGAEHYLTALGDAVRTFNHENTALLYTGTSFSAPVISGAAALLASAFPNLTGRQIVELLLTSADDAGAAGRDTVFGNGILNIARAFQPRGATTLAGSATPVSISGNGTTSTAMGDARGPASLGVIILDGYSRAYALDLARTLARAPQDRPLAGALQGDISSATALTGATAVSVTMRRNLSAQAEVGLALTGLSYQDSRKAKAVAGLALSRLSPRTAVALGFSESGKTLQQRLAGAEQGAFLVARDPMARTGFVPTGQSALGVRHDLGPVALTVTSERGAIDDNGVDRPLGRPGYTMSALTGDRRIGRARLSLGATRLAEESTILGGRFSSAFGVGGATSWFLDGAASFDLGKGWGAAASYRRGRTSLASGGLATGGTLGSEAFAFDLSKRGAFASGDRLAFRVMQPLRVRSGGFDLSVPTSYDYFTSAVGYEARQYGLAPSGRELDFEAAYAMGVFGGDLSANLFLRTDPGHVEAMKSDIGGAIRFSLGF